MRHMLSSSAQCRGRLPPARCPAPFQPLPAASPCRRQHRHLRRRGQCAAALPPLQAALADPAELASLAAASSTALQSAVDSLVAVLPPLAQPAVSTLGGDVASLVALQPTTGGLARLAALYYALFTRPGPIAGEVASSCCCCCWRCKLLLGAWVPSK